MNIRDKIINLDNRDYHMHTLNFSDGANTIDEMVQFAWKFWLKEIAITDHSQASIDEKSDRVNPVSSRTHAKRWVNIHNDVNVIFWVEGDIINEQWDVCLDIQWKEPDFISLSIHRSVYGKYWDLKQVNKAYENAIKRHYKKIKFICHPCIVNSSEYLDIEKLVKVANEYGVALEINGTAIMWGINDEKKHKKMLELWDKFYLNSDAHNLMELRDARKVAMQYLVDNGFI